MATLSKRVSGKSIGSRLITFIILRYGISYHGAAQAASGTKEQVASYREKNKQLFQSIGQFARSNR